MGNALRPDWPVRSLITGMTANHASRGYQDLAVAMAWIATDPETRNPGRLDEPGPWWKSTPGSKAAPDHRYERCPILGHGSYPAWNCGACRSDGFEPSEPQAPPGADFYAQAAVNGVAAAREAVRQAHQAGAGDAAALVPEPVDREATPGRHGRTSHLAGVA